MGTPYINFVGTPGIPYNEQVAKDFGSVLKAYKEGYALGEMPGEYKRKKEKEEYANVLKKHEAENAPEYYKNRAEAKKYENIINMLKGNILGTHGMNQAAEDVEYTKAQRRALGAQKGGSNEEIADALRKKSDAEQEFGKDSEEAKYWKERTKYLSSGNTKNSVISPGLRAFNAMPAAAKENTLAQIRGWGLDDTQTIQLLSAGYTLNDIKDMAKENGVDVDNSQPVYAPTTSTITNIKNAEGIEAELDVLTNDTAEDLGFYGGPTVGGVFPKEVLDSVFGSNKEKRLKWLGARAIQSGIAGARTKFEGGSNAMEAIHGMQKDSLAKVEAFQPGISGEDRTYVQKYIQEKLKKAFKARKQATLSIEHEQKAAIQNSQKSDDEFTTEEVLEALRKGKGK